MSYDNSICFYLAFLKTDRPCKKVQTQFRMYEETYPSFSVSIQPKCFDNNLKAKMQN